MYRLDTAPEILGKKPVPLHIGSSTLRLKALLLMQKDNSLLNFTL